MTFMQAQWSIFSCAETSKISMQVISLFATRPYLAYIHYASPASLYIASASIISIVNKIKWPSFLNSYTVHVIV